MRLEEALNILVSVVTISIAFAIAWTGNTSFDSRFADTFLLILVTVGAGFILHELAHRYVARQYGAHAEYQTWTLGLVLAVAMALLAGFVFAAPGAVYIYANRKLPPEAYGRIALAGPLTNAALALIFIAIGFAFPALSGLAYTGASVNAFLGLFNLIPVFPMDGQKVWAWSKSSWLSAAAALGLLVLFSSSFFG